MTARALSIPILPVALFFGTFAWSFVYVSLPFYIQQLSEGDAISTLRWTGWILGVSSLATVATSPFWGRLANRRDPKTLYVVVELLQGIGFFLMAGARTLPELFLARMLLGIMGAASTFAFVIAGRAEEREVRQQVSAIQSAMTVGQVLGPLAGAVAAARLGFTVSFLVAGSLLWGCAGLVGWGVKAPQPPRMLGTRGRHGSGAEVASACLLVLAGMTQLFFLTAVLPEILPPLGVGPGDTLEVGGLIIFASAVAASLGSLSAPRLADLLGERPVTVWSLTTSSILLALLATAPNAWTFAGLRFFQVLCVAPIFPLAVARVAQGADGQAIGLVNSSRIAAAFVGPVMTTTLLSWFSPAIVYGALALMGLACLPLVLPFRFRREGPG